MNTLETTAATTEAYVLIGKYFYFDVNPPNDWEQHLPEIEELHERLDAQQRGECDE